MAWSYLISNFDASDELRSESIVSLLYRYRKGFDTRAGWITVKLQHFFKYNFDIYHYRRRHSAFTILRTHCLCDFNHFTNCMQRCWLMLNSMWWNNWMITVMYFTSVNFIFFQRWTRLDFSVSSNLVSFRYYFTLISKKDIDFVHCYIYIFWN